MNATFQLVMPPYTNDPLAAEFDAYLAENLTSDLWRNLQAPWDAPIPPRDQWEKELAEFDAHLAEIEADE